MDRTYERAVPADRPFEEFTNAATLGASKHGLVPQDRQGFAADPLRIIRLHWGVGAADLARAGRGP